MRIKYVQSDDLSGTMGLATVRRGRPAGREGYLDA
jgi:hypothetical protein